MSKKPDLKLQTTTLWDYPSQAYGNKTFGDNTYTGVTPAFIVWNLVKRYTKPKDLIVDPMAGSGTTLDVARDLKRRALGYDLQPQRKDIFNVDARKLPLDDEKADFVFIDPPYSTHIKYSGRKECLGELHANSDEYYLEMEKIIEEIYRVLKPNRYMALYVSDSFEKGKDLMAIGFGVYGILQRYFESTDIIAVKRYNAKLLRNHWHTAAVEHNYFLRGFNYLFIMHKSGKELKFDRFGVNKKDRRSPTEKDQELSSRRVKKADKKKPARFGAKNKNRSGSA